MSDKFSKLRFKDLGRIAGAVAISSAVALQPPAAMAATGGVQVSHAGAQWFINTDITFSTTSSGGLAFSEASATGTATWNDAFDGALSWHVDPTPGVDSSNGYVSPGGVTSVVTEPSGATTVTGTTQTLSSLNVTGQVYISNTKAVARSILILQNPTGSDITTTVVNRNNLGSDSGTFVQSTSSGDQTYDASDHWSVSSQTSAPGTPGACCDPIITFAWGGPGATSPDTIVNPISNGDDNPATKWTVTVPAGQTKRIMVFAQLTDPHFLANAISDAATFNTYMGLTGAGYLEGLSAPEQNSIVNWAPSAVVPTLNTWAAYGLAGILGIFGMDWLNVRRRRWLPDLATKAARTKLFK